MIAVFTKNRSNPAYTAARLGADRVAARMGARTVHYVPVKPDDVTEQRALVEQAIAAKPDAALFVAVDVEAMIPSVEHMNAAGIPVFNFINRLAGGTWVSFAGSDDRALGERMARHLFTHLGNRGRVVVMAGTAGSMSGRDRLTGFQAAFDATPDITRAAEICGEFLQDAGRQAMREFLARNIMFDAVLAANDAMALGAIEALEAAGRKLPPVVGINAVPDAVKAIQAGKLIASASFDAMQMAATAAESAIRHLRGERVPHEILLPVEIVTRENCAAWDLPFEQRPLPVWEQITQRRQQY